MKNITAFVCAFALAFLFLFQGVFAQFSDVGPNTKYAEAIWWLSDNGIIQGYPDGTFKPEKCVNRVEFLKMLYLTNETEINDAPANSEYEDMFFDVDTSQWYWRYLYYALETGTVEGYPDGSFKPAQCTKRVEAIKMGVLEFNEGEIPQYNFEEIEALVSSFKDIYEDAWYFNYFSYALYADILGMQHVIKLSNPDSDYYGVDQYYGPGGDMSRKEVSEMLYRLKTIKDNNIVKYSDAYIPEPI